MNRNGFRKIVLSGLFVFGVSLILFPIIGEMITHKKQREEIASMKENILGELKIPSIDVDLPIYKGVDEERLEIGVGHVEGTNLPGEGKGTQCLLAGHRGLPRARLLARLGEVRNGDVFFVTMGEETYQYHVCMIRVIKPDDTEEFMKNNKQELVSIITCTPYGINTHRLVVTGERIH